MAVIIEIEEGWLAYHKSLEWWSSSTTVPEIRTDRDLTAKPTNKRGWFLCPHRPTTLWYPKKVSEYTGWVVLQDGYVPSDKLPARIKEADGFDWDDYPASAYARETEPKPDERVEVDFAACRVITPEDGRQLPDLPEFARWVPSWKVDMLESAEVHAWLPGSLVGFRRAFGVWLASQPGVQPRFGGKIEPDPSGKFHVQVRLMWSDGRTVLEKQGRKMVRKPTWVLHNVDLSEMPDGVQGRGQWEAVERWEALMAHWKSKMTMLGAQACGHCDGKGYLVGETR